MPTLSETSALAEKRIMLKNATTFILKFLKSYAYKTKQSNVTLMKYTVHVQAPYITCTEEREERTIVVARKDRTTGERTTERTDKRTRG